MFKITVEFISQDGQRRKVIAEGEIREHGAADYFHALRNYKCSLGERSGVVTQWPVHRRTIWDLIAEAISRSDVEVNYCEHFSTFEGETEDWCGECGQTLRIKELCSGQEGILSSPELSQ